MTGATKGGNHYPRKKICNTIFTLKASAAIILGSMALAFNGYKVYDLYNTAQAILSQRLAPISIDPNSCRAPTGGLARLEPPTDSQVMFGFHYDWIKDNPVNLSPKLGFYPAVSNAYLVMDPSLSPTFNYSLFEWHAQEIQRIGGIMAMTMQPTVISNISDAQIEELANQCLRVNTVYGVPLFMRFAHEMNGDWPSYGMRPVAFKNAFQRLATSIHSKTNMTAMVFGPNIGITYPFTFTTDALSAPPTLAEQPEEFRALDTNNDGVISNLDDPYTPYYPGDEYVDWVGISIYWYPDTRTGFNILPPLTYYQDMITSTGPSMAIVDETKNGDPLRNFYQNFVVQRGKPMMIPETSAPFSPNQTGPATDAAIKQVWYQQILSTNNTQNNFPRIKLVVQFEEQKGDGNGQFQDWRVTADPSVFETFKATLAQSRASLKYATDFKVDCGGNWIAKSPPPIGAATSQFSLGVLHLLLLLFVWLL